MMYDTETSTATLSADGSDFVNLLYLNLGKRYLYG